MNSRPLMLMIRNTVAVLTLAGAAIGCPYTTDVTEVGVRTVTFSFFGSKGVEDKVYPPGSTFFFFPILNDWSTFDTRLNNLEMSAVAVRGDRPGRDDVVFKTIDGNDIGLDIIISYRIDPEKAPYILQEVARNDADLKENIVRIVARSKPRDIFGEMQTEDFYLAENRSEKAREVAQKLNEILNPYGIIVERVGTRDYRFSPEYEKAIADRKVADQRTERLRSETNAVEQEYVRRVQEALGEVAQTRAQADGEFRRAVLEADAYYEKQEQTAKAIEAEGRAEAEAILRMNEALSGPGGLAMVKLEIAEALQGKRIVFIPMGGGGLDVRSTDINDLLQLYGIQHLMNPSDE